MAASPQLSTSSSVRDRTRERRRQLVALSSRGISEQGYDKFSVNDLAVAAGLSVGGIYRYISTKSDLLVMACEDIYGGLQEALEQAVVARSGCEQQLRAAFGVYLAACEDARDQVILLYREYRHLPAEAQHRYMGREARITELFAELIAAGQRSSDFQEGADARTVAQDMVLLGHLPALKGWALRGRAGPDLARQQVDIVITALRSAPAQAVGRRSAESPRGTEQKGKP